MDRLRRWDVVAAVGLVVALAGGLHFVLHRPVRRSETAEWRRIMGCQANLCNAGLQLLSYAGEHDGWLPDTPEQAGLAATRMVECAERAYWRGGSEVRLAGWGDYEYMGRGLRLDELPSCYPLLFDLPWNHSDGSRNVFFAGADCRTLSRERFDAVLQEAATLMMLRRQDRRSGVPATRSAELGEDRHHESVPHPDVDARRLGELGRHHH